MNKLKINKLNPDNIILNNEYSVNDKNTWCALVQVYQDFSKESTVHGIKYTTQAKTTVEKFLWLTVVVISLVASSELANKFYKRHESANMRTTVVSNQFPSLRIAIPAFTICQGYLVSAERLEALTNGKTPLKIPADARASDLERGVAHLREIVHPEGERRAIPELERLQRILDANGMSLAGLLEAVSPRCGDLLAGCVYEGRLEACERLFVPTVTSHGICCSFNNAAQKRSSLSQRKGSEAATSGKDRYSINFGSQYIMSVLLKSSKVEDRLASFAYNTGYKILIHERHTLPGPNSLDFVVASGHETIVSLQGTLLTSSPEVLDLPTHQRECRKSQRSSSIYRSENCYMRCRDRAIRRSCGCVPFYANDAESIRDSCNLTHVPCLARIVSNVNSMPLRNPGCDCLPDCESTRYTASITGQPLEAAKFKPGRFFELAQKIPNSTALHLTFADQTATLERRELVLSWINLVSSLGGVFSLFLGCSFISVIEFFYFFFYQLILKLKFKNTRNDIQK
ncbi:hypothetical protein TKK_0002213 [Trichogramma kaykai]|uniref:Sodium channel protein Nach n=1 Tax=Trichogramma kaykai TaxID=54128 RepID=A0ABD2XAY2_9HYME